MGLFNFIKDTGQKLFSGQEAQAGKPQQGDPDALNASAGEAIAKYIETQKLALKDLKVSYDGASGTVTLTGQADTQQDAEKATLAAGNVAHVTKVDNQLQVINAQPQAQFHDVQPGDTLSAIAKKVYGDPNKYNIIFEANKPMLNHPDSIYPGQKLRIPPL